ncbi:MAG: cell division protein FtsZ [Verrucomicrobiota bacterium JB023]|nr:cell division protein FtsZ [Verrucomicrobiota bacterium JB023]
MIPFERDRQQTIPTSDLKVIGLGGAGANMLDRAALDGMDGAELLALNTDMRTLAQSMAGEKIQLGENLTKGLGAGGDPELGKQAVLEAEEKVREALKGRRIIFLCVGLGGGTGSGAAPIVTRLAREEGAFVVVFATMPFSFEGQRRREQAETALNELAVLSNALVTFDNGRMGELVLAKQGIHEAFTAADRMISESIKAVTRLVLKPGLVNVGLDDLVTALKTTRSRCLFGSGLSKGKNRAQAALKNALGSPLLDRGSLLKDAESVLVHVSGGEDMTLFEVELLMQGLTKHVPKDAHILFGAAIDPAMGENLSVTVISALPENKLIASEGTEAIALPEFDDEDEDEDEFVKEVTSNVFKRVTPAEKEDDFVPEVELEDEEEEDEPEEPEEGEEEVADDEEPEAADDEEELVDDEPEPEEDDEEDEEEDKEPKLEDVIKKELEDAEDPEEEPDPKPAAKKAAPAKADKPKGKDEESVVTLRPSDRKKPVPHDQLGELEDDDWEEIHPPEAGDSKGEKAFPEKKSSKAGQTELQLDGGPKGRFEGESPNVIDGEDLDVPPYLRKRTR